MKKILDSLVNYKYFAPPDAYERHKFISKFIKPGKKILDVGGSMSRLGGFTKNCTITTADITKPADIVYNGKKIPVKDKSYEVITSIDVLEHIPAKDRADFIKELVRVGSELIIVSAPLGTDYHLNYEKRILKYYQSKKIKLPFLEEHVKIGLPTPKEMESFRKTYKGTLYYSGDVRLTDKLFKIHNFEVKNKYLNYGVFFLKLGFNFVMNTLFYYGLVNRKQSEYINRFYFVIQK